MMSSWVSVDSNLTTGVFIKRGKFGHRRTHRRTSHEDEGRDWRDASASQGTLKTASSPGKLGEARGPSSRALGGSMSDPANSPIVDANHECSPVLRQQVCGNLFQQPRGVQAKPVVSLVPPLLSTAARAGLR